MKTIKLILALGLGALVTACGSVPDVASRNAPFEQIAPQVDAQAVAAQSQLPQSMRIAQVNVSVPSSLKVSEANKYYPRGDIVWRGDAIGDRRAQVKSIFETAVSSGTYDMLGATDVVLDIEVQRFHSLSEKARYTIGGVHNMHFLMTVRSAQTGLALAPTRTVEANLPAFGGDQAIDAERRGQTQKVRVTGYLAQVIREQLEKPSVETVEPRVTTLTE